MLPSSFTVARVYSCEHGRPVTLLLTRRRSTMIAREEEAEGPGPARHLDTEIRSPEASTGRPITRAKRELETTGPEANAQSISKTTRSDRLGRSVGRLRAIPATDRFLLGINSCGAVRPRPYKHAVSQVNFTLYTGPQPRFTMHAARTRWSAPEIARG